jgi:arylformamidase
VKGATLCSGMYDLKPVRLSKRSDYVNSPTPSKTLSTQRHQIASIAGDGAARHLETPGFSARAEFAPL